jgi:hypothetical protein
MTETRVMHCGSCDCNIVFTVEKVGEGTDLPTGVGEELFYCPVCSSAEPSTTADEYVQSRNERSLPAR